MFHLKKFMGAPLHHCDSYYFVQVYANLRLYKKSEKKNDIQITQTNVLFASFKTVKFPKLVIAID